MSGKEEVGVAAARAEEAFAGWSGMTAKSRAAVMFRFHALLEKHADELVRSCRPGGEREGMRGRGDRERRQKEREAEER